MTSWSACQGGALGGDQSGDQSAHTRAHTRTHARTSTHKHTIRKHTHAPYGCTRRFRGRHRWMHKAAPMDDGTLWMHNDGDGDGIHGFRGRRPWMHTHAPYAHTHRASMDAQSMDEWMHRAWMNFCRIQPSVSGVFVCVCGGGGIAGGANEWINTCRFQPSSRSTTSRTACCRTRRCERASDIIAPGGRRAGPGVASDIIAPVHVERRTGGGLPTSSHLSLIGKGTGGATSLFRGKIHKCLAYKERLSLYRQGTHVQNNARTHARTQAPPPPPHTHTWPASSSSFSRCSFAFSRSHTSLAMKGVKGARKI